MLIRISGPAEVALDTGKPVVDPKTLKKLDGAASDDECSNYLDGNLADLGLTGGTVKLLYDKDKTHWKVVTEYTAPQKLTSGQLKKLVDETKGQWSDGIGEGCFDDLLTKLEITIDLNPSRGPKVKVEQIDDGKPVRKGNNALAKAAREGDLDTVRKLLDGGANIDAHLQGFPPLQLAILYGHAEVALELIDRGADIAAEDKEGCDALFDAAASNSMTDKDAERVSRVLLERGIDANKPRGKGITHTVLELARNRKKKSLVKVLRAYGALK